MRRLAPCLVLAIGSAACLDAGRATDWPTTDLSFLVSVEPDLNTPPTPTDVLGPFSSAPEALTYSTSSARRTLLLSFRDTEIQSLRRSAALSDTEAIELSFSEWEPSCARGERLEDGRLRFGLGRFGEVFELGEDGFLPFEGADRWLLDHAVLTAREVRSECLSDKTLAPFGDRPELLADNPTLGERSVSSQDEKATTLMSVLMLDDDRTLAHSAHFLFLFERGRPFQNQPGHLVAVNDLYPNSLQSEPEFVGLVRAEGASGERFVVLSRETDPEAPRKTSRIDIYRAEGFGLEHVSTSSLSASFEFLVTDGRWLYVVDGDGQDGPRPILIATSPDDPFVESTLLEQDLETAPVVGANHELYFVENDTQEVFVFDPSSGRITRLAVQPESATFFSSLDTRSLSYDRDAKELLISLEREDAGAFEHIYSRYSFETEQWRTLEVELGPEALACAGLRPPCGDIVPVGYLQKPTSARHGHFALINACRVLVDLEAKSGCESSIIESAELPIARDPTREWEALALYPDRVLVAGARGILLELSR